MSCGGTCITCIIATFRGLPLSNGGGGGYVASAIMGVKKAPDLLWKVLNHGPTNSPVHQLKDLCTD